MTDDLSLNKIGELVGVELVWLLSTLPTDSWLFNDETPMVTNRTIHLKLMKRMNREPAGKEFNVQWAVHIEKSHVEKTDEPVKRHHQIIDLNQLSKLLLKWYSTRLLCKMFSTISPTWYQRRILASRLSVQTSKSASVQELPMPMQALLPLSPHDHRFYRSTSYAINSAPIRKGGCRRIAPLTTGRLFLFSCFLFFLFLLFPHFLLLSFVFCVFYFLVSLSVFFLMISSICLHCRCTVVSFKWRRCVAFAHYLFLIEKRSPLEVGHRCAGSRLPIVSSFMHFSWFDF